MGFVLFHSSGTPFLITWLNCLASDAIGVFTVAPLIMGVAHTLYDRPAKPEIAEGLLTRNEYLAAENRILEAQVRGRLCLSNADKATLGEIGHRLGRKALGEVANAALPDTIWGGIDGLSPASSMVPDHVGVLADRESIRGSSGS